MCWFPLNKLEFKETTNRIRNLKRRTFNGTIQISNISLVITNVFLDFDRSKTRLGHFLCSLFKNKCPPNKSMKQPKPSSSSPSLYRVIQTIFTDYSLLYKAHKPVYQTKIKFKSKALLDRVPTQISFSNSLCFPCATANFPCANLHNL